MGGEERQALCSSVFCNFHHSKSYLLTNDLLLIKHSLEPIIIFNHAINSPLWLQLFFGHYFLKRCCQLITFYQLYSTLYFCDCLKKQKKRSSLNLRLLTTEKSADMPVNHQRYQGFTNSSALQEIYLNHTSIIFYFIFYIRCTNTIGIQNLFLMIGKNWPMQI